MRPIDYAPDELDAPFWEGCREHRFLVHRCSICERAYWPASSCIDHGADTMHWEPGTGRGVVHTFTVVRHAYDPSLAGRIPYVIAVVQLDDGPFFHTDIVGCDPDRVHVDQRVRVVFDDIDEQSTIPRFTPEDGHATPGSEP